MNKLKILALGIPLLPLWMAASAQAETGFLVHARALSGQPRVVLARGENVPLTGERAMRPGERIVTGGASRALLRLSRGSGCRLALELEPNSSLQLTDSGPGGAYSARLDRGGVKCRGSSCGLRLSVATPTGILSGRDAEFALRTRRHSTTVILASGRMRLLVGGQTFELREMTRTTVSKTGGHRIATMRGGDFRTPPFSRAASPSPASLSPVSAGRRFPHPVVSPASSARRP